MARHPEQPTETTEIADSPPQKITPAVRRRMMIALIVQVFLSVLGVAIVGPVLPLYARSFGVSAALVGSLITAFGLARLMTNLPAGRLADRVGRRPLIAGGMGLVSLAALLSGLATNFAPLLFFRFLQGVGSSIQTTAALIALADISTPKDRGRIMSLYMGSLLIGASMGPSIGGLVGERWGLRAPFFAYSALAFVGAVWGFAMTPETVHLASEDGTPNQSHGGGLRETLSVLRVLMRNGSFVLVGLLSMVIFIARAGSRSTVLPLFGDSLGLQPGQIGVILTVMAAANLVIVRPAGSLVDRFGRKAIIVPASLLSAVALILFPFGRSYTSLVIFGIIWGIGTGFVGPAPAAYAADLARPGQYGLTMGLFKTFGDLGVTLGPLLVGWLSDQFGYGAAFQANAAMFAVIGIAFALFARETVSKKDKADAPISESKEPVASVAREKPLTR